MVTLFKLVLLALQIISFYHFVPKMSTVIVSVFGNIFVAKSFAKKYRTWSDLINRVFYPWERFTTLMYVFAQPKVGRN